MHPIQKTFFTILWIFIGFGSAAQNWDINLLKKINHPQSPNATKFFKITSNSAYVIPFAYPALSFTFGKIKKSSPLVQESFFSASSLATACVLSYSIKLIGKRDRPYVTYPNELIIDKPSKTYSFPSGHTTAAFCSATSMALYYNKWYVTIPAYAWACSVAYSRMYLGKHYPTDILGGMVLGIGIPMLFHYCQPVNRFVNGIGQSVLHY